MVAGALLELEYAKRVRVNEPSGKVGGSCQPLNWEVVGPVMVRGKVHALPQLAGT